MSLKAVLDVTVTFWKRTSAKARRYPSRLRGRGQLPAVASVTIRGPQHIAGSGDTPSRRRVFVCTPSGANDEDACARKIFSALARRAYRRPVVEADLQPILAIYHAERGESGFEGAVKQGLERILVSPQFLFRIESQPAKAAPGAGTASAMSTRIAAVIFPLEQHPTTNCSISLRTASCRIAPCSSARCAACCAIPIRALATNFAAQWLYLRDINAKSPRPRLFPDFDLSLREAFERETTLFLASVFREDRSAVDLLRANDTFMNERLAKHYGVPNVLGNDFRRVTHPADSPRRGLGLRGHSSILTITSYANRTSPVLRGKYVLGNLLGAPPPPPPPNIRRWRPKTKIPGRFFRYRGVGEHRATPVAAVMRHGPDGFCSR